MRGTIAASLCVILGSCAGLCQAQETADRSAVRLGRPIVRAQDAEDSPRVGQPGLPAVQLPTLGKPILGGQKSSAPASEPPAPRTEPPVMVEHRPEPPPLPDLQIRPATFALPPAKADVEGKAEPPPPETPKLEAAYPVTSQPALDQTPETLPMPRAQPTLMMPGATGPMPPSEGVYTRPSTKWEIAKYKAQAALEDARWMPAKLKARLGLGESCLLAPDLPCFDPCCGEPPCCNKLYAGLEYLRWNVRSLDVVPLVTTTTNPTQEIGAIGQPGTQVLYGGEIDHGWQSGGRFTVGAWLDPCHELGLEAVFFFLEQGHENFGAASDRGGNPLLARPFLDEGDGRENVELVSDPGRLAGAIVIESRTRLWGGEINLRAPLGDSRPCFGWCKDVQVVGGFRYLNLHDDIKINEGLFVIGTDTQTPPGTNFDIFDLFHTENQFYGGQIGVDVRLRKCKWVVDLRTRLAAGINHQEVEIAGATVETLPGQMPIARTGGLLAQRTNIGHYERNEFSMATENGLTLGYQVHPCVRVFAGYSFLYWTSVARADQQIDRVVNSQLLSGGTGAGTRPAFQFKDREFWAHGLNVGVEMKY